MLFSDFFPRLQAVALDRYGQELTERQFKDWREDGLLPAPAPPKGRGRGRSPERHWPLAAYRRALRICRYRSFGCYRTSHWWIGFWLSGEDVPEELLKRALKREFVTLRRESRRVSESGRWMNSTFSTLADLEGGGPDFGSAGFTKLMRIDPDVFRRAVIHDLEEPFGSEDIDLVRKLMVAFFELPEDVELDFSDKREFYRAGYLSDIPGRDAEYILSASQSDLQLAVRIFRAQKLAAMWSYALLLTWENRNHQQILICIFSLIRKFQVFRIANRIDDVVKIMFEIYRDKSEGINPFNRLELLEKAISENRQLTEFRLSELRQAGRIDLVRPSSLIADMNASLKRHGLEPPGRSSDAVLPD